MSYTPPNPTADDLNKLFPPKLPPPDQGVFEIGLVLGGTVSAGAYTAGVLDFLTEALDAWDIALQTSPGTTPGSRVVLKVVGGASGGGVCSAILGRVAPYAFPHVSIPTDNASTGNLFYDVWVNTLDVAGMLTTGDLDNKQPLASVLNVAPIDNAGKSLVQYVGHPLGEANTNTPAKRRWLDPTLTMFLTMTNLRGIPYKVDFNGGAQNDPQLQQNFVNHGDYVRFELDTQPGVTIPVRPDAFGVSLWRDGANFVDWDTAAEFGVATGAFPIGFKARELSRPLDHYAYRVVAVPNDKGSVDITWLPPDWDALNGDSCNGVYNFPCVDGGGTDNAPVDLVRTALAGIIGRNPHSGDKAYRAVVLIDPFAAPVQLGPQSINDLQSTLAPFIGGLIGEARYSTADLMLAADNNVFSRFMITARRGEFTGTDALATGGLSAFQGFLCRDFRQHDYLLGRRNAYDFLKNQFLLPDTNLLFAEPRWMPGQKTDFGSSVGGVNYLPIIPLFGTAATPPQYPIWPANKLDPDCLHDPIDARIKAVTAALENADVSSNFFVKLAISPIVGKVKDALMDAIMGAIAKSLQDSNL